jgi:hypothetical protein
MVGGILVQPGFERRDAPGGGGIFVIEAVKRIGDADRAPRRHDFRRRRNSRRCCQTGQKSAIASACQTRIMLLLIAGWMWRLDLATLARIECDT